MRLKIGQPVEIRQYGTDTWVPGCLLNMHVVQQAAGDHLQSVVVYTVQADDQVWKTYPSCVRKPRRLRIRPTEEDDDLQP